MQQYLKTALVVVVTMAIVNRIAILKTLVNGA